MLLVGELSHRRAGSSTASAEYFRIYHECGTNGTFTAPLMCRDQSPHQPVLLPAMQHPGKLFIRKLFPPRPITQLPAPNEACTRALLPAQTCRARHTFPTTAMAANPPQGSRSKGSTRSITCTGPASQGQVWVCTCIPGRGARHQQLRCPLCKASSLPFLGTPGLSSSLANLQSSLST